MRYQVNKGILLHNGVRYANGAVIVEDVAKVNGLVESGVLIPIAYEPEAPNQTNNEVVDAPTIEEFAELKAEEQKQILTELGYEPGTNKEDRIAQYTEWYDSDDGNDS